MPTLDEEVRDPLAPHSYCTCWENKGRCIDCAEEQLAAAKAESLTTIAALLDKGQSYGNDEVTVLRNEDHAEMLITIEQLKADLAAALERVGELDGILHVSRSLRELLEAEVDELKADAVRFNIHLEQKDRALKANAEEYRRLQQDCQDLLGALVEHDKVMGLLWYAGHLPDHIAEARDAQKTTDLITRVKANLAGAGERTNEHPESTCQKCHGPNIVWFAPSDLWNQYHGDYEILCPICFVEAVEVAGTIPPSWVIAPEESRTYMQGAEVCECDWQKVTARDWYQISGAGPLFPGPLEDCPYCRKAIRALPINPKEV